VEYWWSSFCGATEWLSDVVVAVQIVPCGADDGCGIQGSSTVGRCGVVGVVKMVL